MTNPILLTSIHGDLLGITKQGNSLCGMALKGIHVGRVDLLAGSDYFLWHPSQHCEVFDDFLGLSLDNVWGALHGSDGTAAAALTPAIDGVMLLTSGAGSTHTAAVNGAQIVGGLNFQAQGAAGTGVNNGLRFEASVGKISALTSQSIFIGLCDSTSLSAPFTRATTTTTANATNGAGFLQDSASTNTNLYAVAVNAGGSPQSTALNVAVSTTAYKKYRVEIDGLGNATYFIDGVQVAYIALAVAVTAALAPTVEMFSNATSASQTLKIDYISTRQER